MATTDGGAHWGMQLHRRIAGARLDFIDRDHGWLLADGSLSSTSDGGQTWSSLPVQCPGIVDVHFSAPEDGFAITGARGRSGRWHLLRTADGGRSWRRVPSPPEPQQVCMTDASNGWLAAGARIYRTQDGASTWTLVEPGVRRQHRSPGSAEVQCAGPDDAWAITHGGVGMSQEAHTAFHLHDADSYPIYSEQYYPHPGVRTRVSSPSAYGGPLSAVSPTAAVFIDFCPACGMGTASVAVTYDAGRTLLRRGQIPGLTQATGASFVTGDEGWVIGVQRRWRNHHEIGERYRILRTLDGARTWTPQWQLTMTKRS